MDFSTVSPQSQVTLISGIVVALALIIYQRSLMPAAVIILITFILASYNINCVIGGNCYNWSIFLTVMYVLYAASMLYTIYKKKTQPELAASQDMA